MLKVYLYLNETYFLHCYLQYTSQPPPSLPQGRGLAPGCSIMAIMEVAQGPFAMTRHFWITCQLYLLRLSTFKEGFFFFLFRLWGHRDFRLENLFIYSLSSCQIISLFCRLFFNNLISTFVHLYKINYFPHTYIPTKASFSWSS